MHQPPPTMPPPQIALAPSSAFPAPPLLAPAATATSPSFAEMNVSIRVADLFAFAAALRGGDHGPAAALPLSNASLPTQTCVAPACIPPLNTPKIMKPAIEAAVGGAAPVLPSLHTACQPDEAVEPPPLLPPDDDRIMEDMDWLDFVSEGDDDVGPVLALPEAGTPPPLTLPPQLAGQTSSLNRDSPLPSTESECGGGVRPPNTPPAASLPRQRSTARIDTLHFDVNLLPPLLRPFADQLQPPPPGGMTQAVPIIALVPEHLTRARPRCPPPTRRRGRVRRTDHLLVQDGDGGLVLMSPAEYQRMRRCVTNVASARRVANARRSGSSTDDDE